MNVDETKVRPTDRQEGIRGLVELAQRVVPAALRDAETLVPVSKDRSVSLLRRAREVLDWRRLQGQDEKPPKPPEKLQVVLARRFSIFVLVPTAFLAAYLYLIASDQYIAESQFAVRGNVEQMSDASIGSYDKLIHQHNSQDSFIIRDFTQSRTMVEDAEKTLGISKMFSRDGIDFWTRYSVPQPMERLTRYWGQRVTAHIEALSGVISLKVRAFTPEDAVAISELVISRSERLVNQISERARADMLSHAEGDVRQAEDRLKKARFALQTFRNDWGIIDPAKTAENTITTILGLTKDRLKADNDLKVLRDSKLDEKSRGIQVLIATIAAIDGQIKQLQDQLTTAGLAAGASNNITQALLEFEGHMIEQSIAEKLLEGLRLYLDRIRVSTQKQQVYLAIFVPPAVPTYAVYPLRGYSLLIGLFCFFVLWSIGSLIFAGFMDQRL